MRLHLHPQLIGSMANLHGKHGMVLAVSQDADDEVIVHLMYPDGNVEKVALDKLIIVIAPEKTAP